MIAETCMKGKCIMKKLFESADRYLQESDWKDLALIKFCLFSMGLLIGMQLPKKFHKAVKIGAAVVFVGTYIPLMVKYARILLDKRN